MPKYPSNWKERSLEIRAASAWRCQNCKRQCRKPKESVADFITRTGYEKALVKAHPLRWTLQAAHLNHDPENEEAELIALCLTCHRQYDNSQMAKIRALERERQGQLSIEQQPAKPLEGLQLPISDLAEPSGVLNSDDLTPVTPGTIAAWIEERLQLFSSVEERLAYLQKISPAEPTHAASVEALLRALPYTCSKESLLKALSQVKRSILERQRAADPRQSKRKRRHRQKGTASGFIESRLGNKARKTPTLSYYYRWDSPEGRVTEYIPMSKLLLIETLIEKRTPAIEILQRLCEGKKKINRIAQRLLNAYQKENEQRSLF